MIGAAGLLCWDIVKCVSTSSSKGSSYDGREYTFSLGFVSKMRNAHDGSRGAEGGEKVGVLVLMTWHRVRTSRGIEKTRDVPMEVRAPPS